MDSELWHIALIDALLLCAVAGMGLSFRAWVKRERCELQQRLDALESQQARLQRTSEHMDSLCQEIEAMSRRHADGAPAIDTAARNEADDVYRRAWSKLDEGASPAAVARELGLGVAEVELMGRMMHLRRRS